MNDYLLIGILSLWLIYQLIIKFLGKEKSSYTIIVTFLFISGYLYFFFYNLTDSMEYTYYYYGTIGAFSLYMVIGNLKKHFKKTISEYDLLALEKDLQEVKDVSELLRKRFISTIEIMNDGISFRDSEDTLFGSDKFISLFGLDKNEFSLEDFENKIYRDDLPQYRNIIEKVSRKNPVYKIDYRVNKDGNLIWLKEIGKRIIINKKITYISIIKALDIKQYPSSEVDVLNGLQNYRKMYDEMQRLCKEKRSYNLIVIKLTNVPKINDKYGRDVGDLMMGEYLQKLRYNFIKDNHSLYRIGGINFGLLIKEEKKFEFLERALTGGGELLNLKMIFGGITQTLYPNLGIAESPYEGKTPDKLIEEANEALEISLRDNTNSNYCFYDRI